MTSSKGYIFAMDELCSHFTAYGMGSLSPSPVNRFMAQFSADFRQNTDINLGVGYVNEATIPKSEIQSITKNLFDTPDEFPLFMNYGAAKGDDGLIASIRRYLSRTTQLTGWEDANLLQSQEIVIGSNGATSILEGLGQLFKPGIVITSDPWYYIYCEFLIRMGFQVICIPEDGRGLNINMLERKVSSGEVDLDALRFAYVVTINNPSAVVMDYERKLCLVELFQKLSTKAGRVIPVFFDRAYDELLHASHLPRPRSVLPAAKPGYVYEIGTFSKFLAPTLRIGYIIGAKGPLTRAMIQRNSDTGFSAPLFNQIVAAELLDEMAEAQQLRVIRGYAQKSEVMKAALETHLSGQIKSLSGGQGGFYYYVTLDDIDTSEESPFFKYCSRTTGNFEIDGPVSDPHPRVVYIPGKYCVHPEGVLKTAGRNQLRLSYGFENAACFDKALRLMGEAARYARAAKA